MWIVRIALSRPYTFIVLALLILLGSPLVILRTPTDIFPNINIPVLASIWNFTGLSAEDMEGRITTGIERNITTTVSDIEHIESLTLSGRAIIKVFLQPGASVDRANAEITAISQSSVRNLPPGAAPPFILTYNASTVPILQLALSSPTLPESQLQDLGQNFVRPQLVTVPGAELPYPYGGKQRQINVALNTALLQAKGLSPADVVTALGNQNVVLPSGTAKIGQFEYDVDLNSSPARVEELNDLPIKQVGNSTIYVRDVATVSDGFAPQTNIVRLDGQRGSLISVLKSGNASTLDVVKDVKDVLPSIQKTLPSDLKIQQLADQSFFVRAAINGVVREAIIAACLTGIMILIFLGSWRSTLIIAVSIPLSILVSICVLSALHETINIMTLGGLALAVGILVDDATVTIENIERYLEEGHDLHTAILEGAAQIAVPALVSTLCICIVFLPMFFLSGVAKYLFVPLAEAVVFAMLASYILSRTLVPTLAMYLLKVKAAHGRRGGRTWNPFALFQQAFDRGFERLRLNYQLLLTTFVYRRFLFVPAFLVLCLGGFLLFPWLGQDFFPSSDNGQFRLHFRTKTGTRIEETARLNDLIDQSIRRMIPPRELDSIVDNIGVPQSGINTTYDNSGLIGSAEGNILVSLKEKHRPTQEWVTALRPRLNREYPDTMFYFLPADMVTQILNFGLPAPIDIQVVGADNDGNRKFADSILPRIERVPGVVDARIQQPFDQPKLHINIDRTKAQSAGITEHDVSNSLLVSLSGSAQETPTFFLNPNGVLYSVVTQSPQYAVQSLQDLQNIPITAPGTPPGEILGDVGTIARGSGMAGINHYNIRRVIDIYGAVEGRDLGAAGQDVTRIVDAARKNLPHGSDVVVRGQLDTMRTSYIGLAAGLGVAIVLVYLLIVVNFQSWLDPLIIISALPAALTGIVLFLFLTNTHLSVPALMGSIMCMGVATANSILVVSFAKDRLEHHHDALQAAIEAGFTRFRPVLMTALAMIIGMVPMSLGLGEGGEQNAPLGRAVIGGLLCATVATLFFVPAVFSLIHNLTKRTGAAPAKSGRMEPARM
ncbi:MAG TPA: efflux RND transporter permease subunit [Bryobacteraceae bacterium]|jgi:multidrug efflux pump subunit AcrB|nr:efflux RND transporter permease subunit [Bryobacteraceae bacterium]